MEISIKVTTINGKHHARLFDTSGNLYEEMICECKQDIGYICQQFCRNYDKFGPSDSARAEAARMRQKVNTPVGKIYWSKDLEERK